MANDGLGLTNRPPRPRLPTDLTSFLEVLRMNWDTPRK